MNLMIIESPGKIAKLSAILGDSWKIVASYGHVRDLPQKSMGVEAPAFKPAYELTERGASVVGKLKNWVRQADAVYLATDPDREGESISWHLQQCLKLENPLRVTFNEITAGAVKAALLNPRSVDVKRVAAQEARRVLDRLVGYMVSPELSRQTGERLSAGRVQTPAVLIVVERERAIKAFKPTHHFGAMLFFADAKTDRSWFAEWVTSPLFTSDDSPYFMNRLVAELVADVRSVTVQSCDESVAKRSPPPPFTTSTMQQAASVTLGLNPKAAMEAAQKLFERGHISYHRTDNPNVSDESLADIYAVAVELGLDMADKPRKFKAPASAQAGHPAITPTHWELAEAGDTSEERELYKMIRLRAIACQLADAIYAVRTVLLQATQVVADRPVAFKAEGRSLTSPGWLQLVASDQTEDEGEGASTPDNNVPSLFPGDVLSVLNKKLLEKRTKAPRRYTEATLVGKLESEGIGRPATYAAIMENITSRGYVKTEKKFLSPTPTGELIIDSLTGKFSFLDLGFTRDLEQDLDLISQGKASYSAVISNVHNQLTRELAVLEASSTPKHPCPACGKALVHRLKKGKGGFDFFGCSAFRDGCTTSFQNLNGVPDIAGKTNHARS